MSHGVRGGAATLQGRCEMSGANMSRFTAVPRWTLNPAPGVCQHEAEVPVEIVAELRRLACEVKAPLSAALLTAHAKVLGVLSGEREVWTAYAVENSLPRPCRLTIE